MATSRGGTPANPTLVATTDDAARGGLFARSNIGNLSGSISIEGENTHVSSVAFNDTSRVLTITLNDGTDFTATIPGGGGSTGPTTDTHVNDVRFDQNSRNLEIHLNDGTVYSVTVPAGTAAVTTSLGQLTDVTLTGQTDGQALTYNGTLGAWVNKALDSTDLGDFPNTLGSTGQNLRVNTAGTALEFYTPTTSGVTTGEFSSTDNTVDISDNGGLVNLASRPLANARSSNAQGGSNSAMNWTTISVNSALRGPNGRPLVFVVSSGNLMLTEEGAAPPNPTGPTDRGARAITTSVFMAPEPETFTINISDGNFDTNDPTRTPVMVTQMNPDGSTDTVMPANVVTNNVGNDATVMVTVTPDDDGGTTTITTTPTVIPTGGGDMTPVALPPIEDTITRFIPFVQFRGTAPDSAVSITGATEGVSTTAWPSNNILTVRDGSGSLFLAVDQAAGLGTTNRRVLYTAPDGRQANINFGLNPGTSNITVSHSAGSVTYNIYRFAGSPEVGGTIDLSP